MTSEGDTVRKHDRRPVEDDFINSLSQDALSVIKVDLLIITLFLSVLGLIFRESTREYLIGVGNSVYTHLGFQLLIGSLLASAILYFRIRQVGAAEFYPDRGMLKDEKILSYSVAAAVLGSVLGVISLLIGILDGFGEGSPSLLDAAAPLVTLWLIMFLFVILTLPDLAVRSKRRLLDWWE